MISHKPSLTPTRIYLAFAVAGFADFLQIPLHYFDGSFIAPWLAAPIQYLGYLIDILTATVAIILLGFHPALLPGFIVKVVPMIAGLPTWTACVGYVVWARKQETPKPVETTGKATEPETEAPEPRESEPEEFAQESSKPTNSGLWLLVSASVLVAAWFWHKHQPHHAASPPRYVIGSGEATPAAVTPLPSLSPTDKQRVVVGPIENQSTSDASLNFEQTHRFHSSQNATGQTGNTQERIRTLLEDILQNIDGVNLLGREQAQLFTSQYEANTTDASEKEKQAQLRAIMAPNIIVFGAILDIHEDKTEIKAYGTEMQSLHSECTVRIQVMDSSDGSITFSKTLTASKTKTVGNHVTGTSTDDQDYELLKSALHKLADDADFKRVLLGQNPNELVMVNLSPTSVIKTGK